MDDDSDDDLKYLLGEIDTQLICTFEEVQEELLKDGLIPDNLLTGNVFSNGQNALHILLKTNLPSYILDYKIDKILKLGVDPRIKDNDGKLCTDGNVNYNQINKKIHLWILTRYPTIWTTDFVRKHVQKIFNLGYQDYYYEVVNHTNKIVIEAMNKYYKK
jgi:hypothetical protein